MNDVAYSYDDVTFSYDDVTYSYDDVTFSYDDAANVYTHTLCSVVATALSHAARYRREQGRRVPMSHHHMNMSHIII